ncbi:MAG: gliding motility-associated C-terminal domain-containing protein, partial [Bacteroidota bacterium]
SKATLRIYTSRGNLVYETQGFNNPWDGRQNGIILPADVYFYTIDLNVPYIKKDFKGVVMLLR